MSTKPNLIDMHYIHKLRGGVSLLTYAHIDELVSWGCHITGEWGETSEGVSSYEKSARHLQAALIGHLSRMRLRPLMGGALAFKASATKKARKIENVRGVVEYFDGAYDLLQEIDTHPVSPLPGDEFMAGSLLVSALARLEFAIVAPPGFPVRWGGLGDGIAPPDRAPYARDVRSRKPYQR